MGTSGSKFLANSNVELDYDKDIVEIKEFELDDDDLIHYEIIFNQGHRNDYKILDVCCEEVSGRMSDHLEVGKKCPFPCEEKGKLVKVRSGKGVVPFEAIFRGLGEPEASIVILRASDNVLILWAHVVWKGIDRKTIILEEKEDEEQGSITVNEGPLELSEARKQHFKRLINRLHSATIYGIFDKETIEKVFLESKEYERAHISYILADDDTPMAFRSYFPSSSVSVQVNIIVIGFDVTFLEPFAKQLTEAVPIAVYVCDPRGFGFSSGKRGYAKTEECLFKDIRSFVRMVRHNSDLPIYLMGMIITGGLLVNYVNWAESEPVEGVILPSTNMGVNADKPSPYFQSDKIQKMEGAKKMTHQMLDAKMFSRRTGRFALKFNMTEEVYELDPVAVEHISPAAINSCHLEDPKAALKVYHDAGGKMKLIWGSEDELLVPDKLAEFAADPNDVLIINGLNHYQVFYDERFYDAISQFIDAPLTIAQTTSSEDTSNDNMKACGTTSFRFSQKLPVKNTKKEFWLDQPDGERLHFQVFFNDFVTNPLALMIFIRPDGWNCQWLEDYASKAQIRIFNMTPRGWHRINDERMGPKNPESLLYDIRRIVKMIKANNPRVPVLLGGIDGGASLVLNYSDWPDKTFVNGLVLLGPLPNPFKDVNASLVKKAFLDILEVQKNGKEKHANLLKRIWRHLFGDKRKKQLISVNMTSGTHQSQLVITREYMDQVLVSDLKKSIENISAPFLLVLPADDTLVNSEKLFKHIRSSANPFKRIEMLPGVKRDGLGSNAQNIVADWVKHVASTSVSREITFKSPMTLQDFNPLEMIGEGTYGKVWLVKHLQSKTYMAMKVQDKSCFTQVYQVNTVVREREILAGLKNSPFLVKYLGAFQDDRRLYILMEYIIGGEIMTRMRQVGRFSPEDARFYIGEILMALKALHEDDIVFRDLKPENVLLDSLGHIRLVDFGSARKVDRKTGRCGSFCGSPFYMAPELLVKGFYDGRQVDFWCFGVLLYEFLVGVPPFRGKTANSIYARVLHEKPIYPASLSSDAKDLLRWCLEKNPEKRPTSIEAIQKHRWFRGIDWERMEDRLYIPPYQPPFASDEDTGNFFKYSLSPEEYFAEDNLSSRTGPSEAGDGELMQFPGF